MTAQSRSRISKIQTQSYIETIAEEKIGAYNDKLSEFSNLVTTQTQKIQRQLYVLI